MSKVVPETKAKQGRSGRQVLMVLVAALVLAGVVWAGVELYGQSIKPDAGTSPTTLESGSSTTATKPATTTTNP